MSIIRQRAYLSGPMTGYPDYNRPAFRKATSILRDSGLEVMSPHEFDEEKPVTSGRWCDYLRRDLIAVASGADLVICLPGWRGSKGATLEVTVAHALGLLVFEMNADMTTWTRVPDEALPVPHHPHPGARGR